MVARSTTNDGPLILLVEDERGIASAFSMLLEIEGYRVVIATDGQSGLERASALRPDLVLTDVRMPVMDGLEMIRRLRADAALRHLPVVLMSGALPSAPDGPLYGGADAFLQMPAGIEELLSVIRRLLGQRAEA